MGEHSQGGVDKAAANVKADAALAVGLCKKYHADLCLADAEDSFQSYNPGDPTPALNRIYVEAFEEVATAAGIDEMPRALSSE